MKILVDQSVVTRSLKRKLHSAEDPARKRRPLAPLVNKPVENRPALVMRLRPRSRSVSPKESAPKKKDFPRKKKPSPPRKKDSPPPSVIRPDSAVGAQASEGIFLRPRQKSPTEKKLSPPQPLSSERKKSPPNPSSLTEKRKKSPTKEKKKSPTEEEKRKKSPTEEKEKKKSPTEEEKKKKSLTEEVKMKVFPPVAVLTRKLPNSEKYRGFAYRLARMLPRIGFTRREYDYCADYMWRLDFEYFDPTPKGYEHLKAYIDQIRNTKGYGVTVKPPPYYTGRAFEVIRQQWKRKPEVREYVAKMIEMVLDDIKVKRPMESYEAGEGIENLVRSGFNYLLSFPVHQGTPTDPSRTVEALFYVPPGGRPILKTLVLQEWKIREGSDVVFCSVPTYETII